MNYKEFVKSDGVYDKNRDILALQSIGGDEYYTMKKDADNISACIKGGHKIWCPFDTPESEFPYSLRRQGFAVVNTWSDFFTTDPPDGCDAIVSNPPFSVKKDILKRIDDLGMKFALILPFLFLNDGVPLDYGRQIILFRKRMHFVTPEGEKNKPRTNCFVLSNGLLKKDFTIIYE